MPAERIPRRISSSTPVRATTSVRLFGSTLDQALEEIARELFVLWVINRQRDSIAVALGLGRRDRRLAGAGLGVLLLFSFEPFENALLNALERQQLVDWGLPPERVIVEPRSRNTHENAVESQRIAREHGAYGPRSYCAASRASRLQRGIGSMRRGARSPQIPFLWAKRRT